MNASKKVFSIFENKTMEQTATKKKALFKSSQIASYLLDNSSSDESTTTKAKEETKSIKIIEPFNKNPFCEKPKKAVKLKQPPPPPPIVTQTKLSNPTTKKPATKAVADVSILDVVEETHKRKELDANKKDVNKALELVARLRAEKEQQGEHHKQEVNKVLEYATKLKAEQKLKEAELNINKLNTNNSLVSEEVTQQAKSSQSDSISSIKQNKTSFEYDTEEVLEIMNSNNDDDDNENEDEIKKKQTRIKPKRDCEYEAIDENLHLEAQIDEITSINLLNQDQIEYMVLRDINYFIDIFSGNCDHSWRHIEFKKYSKKSGNILYCNTALTSYTREQYSAAVQALQNIFCKKDNKCDDYIIKVLLPEALIKICMRIYQCSKEAAEEYLQKNNFKNDFKQYPKGSIVKRNDLN